ncbi:MAG TPA: COX15/CtaA family protein [Gemmatimonadales bacterium]|nr:COX15/CtaA family protein [Gemmatimonadales bacterium]
MTDAHRRAIVAWLYTGCLLIALLVTVGGITRLTGSGLSITEWKVLMGTLPPLNADAWQELWQKYQATPQYQQVNTHFTLEQFKTIFWWEYIHRVLARLLGVVFLLPFLWFLARGYLDRALRNRVILIFALGAFQGLLGWLMVASGLVDRPSVSHFRLAAHLLTALLTFSVTLWTALETGGRADGPSGRAFHPGIVAFTVLLVLQITWGAFVAGLKAGGIFNTFPLMGGSLFPPAFGNPFVDPATVQFVHRVLGTALFGFGLVLWQRLRREGKPGIGAELGGAVTLQFGLGVLTILRWPSNPVFWGAVHQLGAVALLAATVRSLYRSRLP